MYEIKKIKVEGMNEAVVGSGDQSMKQLFATYPELEDGLLIGRLNQGCMDLHGTIENDLRTQLARHFQNFRSVLDSLAPSGPALGLNRTARSLI